MQIIALFGPTGAGKTAVAVALARQLRARGEDPVAVSVNPREIAKITRSATGYGDGNPLGARALYLGNTIYRIHGTNAPETIGQAVSSGCFRLVNDDVIDLYNRIPVGTHVIVRQN